MSDNVLVDTSVWIEYFNVEQSQVYHEVTRLLRERRVVYTGIIALELIRGAKTEKERSTLNTLFRSIERIDEKPTTHVNAGEMGYRLARKGLTVGTVDLLISRLAIEHEVSLYTQDHHFDLVAKHFPVRIHRAKSVPRHH